MIRRVAVSEGRSLNLIIRAVCVDGGVIMGKNGEKKKAVTLFTMLALSRTYLCY